MDQPHPLMQPEEPQEPVEQAQQENQPSKAALKKAAKLAEKQALKEKIQQQQPVQQAYEIPKLTLEQMKDAIFGDYPLHQSQPEFKSEIKITPFSELKEGQQYKIRAYVHTMRATGKTAFVVLREKIHTMQAIQYGNKDLVRYLNSIPRESYVEVFGVYKKAEQAVKSCSIEDFEFEIQKFFTITRAMPQLPLQVEDAARADSAFQQPENKFVNPGRDTRFDNRIIDLRTPANQCIFKIRMVIQQLFSQFMTENGFLQITSPKIIPGASEGGANVFSLQYFEQQACLAQSPQLYKQMAIAAGFQKVFEVGPVFRAEKSNTHRHLCEFTGLDLEMEIKENYHEVLFVLDKLMKYIFKNTLERCQPEIAVIRKQFDMKMPQQMTWTDETVIIDFRQGAQWLQEAGYKQSATEDLTTETERALGRIVKEKYGTDFYILDKFPASIRPFYTMPDVNDAQFSNSYDMFIRGEEICSGAQRIHDPDFLLQNIIKKGINPETLKDYVQAFRYGCAPHGGAGLGLERIIMFILGIEDCRQCCLFPRTPERLFP